MNSDRVRRTATKLHKMLAEETKPVALQIPLWKVHKFLSKFLEDNGIEIEAPDNDEPNHEYHPGVDGPRGG